MVGRQSARPHDRCQLPDRVPGVEVEAEVEVEVEVEVGLDIVLQI